MAAPKIAIIGGGIAGSSAALHLSQLGLEVDLFECEASLLNGPPFCHLHAGGNLYPDISDQQCEILLEESIALVRSYPFAIDYRPTVIALPLTCRRDPQTLVQRLEGLQRRYAELIDQNSANAVLGRPENYFRLYERADLEHLKTLKYPEKMRCNDDWMIPVAKTVRLDQLKYPLILVQEYGLNLFSMSAGLRQALEKEDSAKVHLKSRVESISAQGERWRVRYVKEGLRFEGVYDYLINAAGFRTGEIDDMLGLKRERLVEFKAAYVTHWQERREPGATPLWPEVVFYGARGTPQGMAQFTPYNGHYFQLHGMTEHITLFEGGLARSSALSAQPKLQEQLLRKIEKQWEFAEVEDRTRAAVAHLSRLMPPFKTATVASKPLFGAQQIPGDDPSLRAANLSFGLPRYVRCEIVKVSSVLSQNRAITEDLMDLGYLDAQHSEKDTRAFLKDVDFSKLENEAKKICRDRAYPEAMAQRLLSAPL